MNMIIWTDIGKIKVRLLPDKAPISISILKNTKSRAVPVHFFGKEIFFGLDNDTCKKANSFSKELQDEGQQEIFDVGDVAFWSGRKDIPLVDPLNPGACICIFFGSTPEANEPRALVPINLVGKVIENIELLEQLTVENIIKIEKIE